jgi:hypothetical protein
MIKLFEEYTKIDKIDTFINFMKQYKLTEIIIDSELDKYIINSIKFNKRYDKYVLNYQAINRPYIEVELSSLSSSFIDNLYVLCKTEDLFNIENQLNSTSIDFDNFVNILKNCKEKINFNKDMFTSLCDSGWVEDINKFNFQDILFSTHPESYKPFLDECFLHLEYKNDDPTLEEMVLHPKILIKYNSLLGDYYKQKLMEQKAKKYNII